MKSTRRVWLAPAYILHQYAYRDTSRILEVFTAEHGRVSVFARGASGSKSGVLRPFQRLLLSFSGKSDAGQLIGAEIDGARTTLAPDRLMSGFYLNELIMKLTERLDPHPAVFESYAESVLALSAGASEEPILRRFEKNLLHELGYGLELEYTKDGEPIAADRCYRYAVQSGPQICDREAPGAVLGQSLTDLKCDNYADARTLKDAKRLLRAAIDTCLDGRTLKSREVMLDLKRRESLLPEQR